MSRNVSSKNMASYSHWYTYVHAQREVSYKIESVIIIIIIPVMNYKTGMMMYKQVHCS